MKNTNPSLLSTSLLLTAYSNDDSTKTCLPGSCDELDQDRFNITILLEPDYKISGVEYKLNGEVEAIPLMRTDLDGQKLFSCWHHTDLRPTPSYASSIFYEIERTRKIQRLEGIGLETYAMVIEINSSGASNYDFKECTDIVDN